VGEAVFSAIWISDAAIAIGTDRGLLAIELSPVFLAGRAVK
jgi:hypothetical protein